MYLSKIPTMLAIPTIITISAFISIQVNLVSGLECYVCSNQTGNAEKCLNTIKTCAPNEDVCGTSIRWGSEPYFSQGAKKQHYVSKRCMAKQDCKREQRRLMRYCTHIWYEDWICADCCQGDRCNYYIISGANYLNTISVYLIALIGIILIYRTSH